MSPLPHRITVVEPTTSVDAYGVSVLTYDGAQTVVPAWVQPQASDQESTGTQGSARTLTRLKCYTGTDVALTSRVQYGGTTYEVRSVLRWDDARGQLHHYEVVLQEVAG